MNWSPVASPAPCVSEPFPGLASGACCAAPGPATRKRSDLTKVPNQDGGSRLLNEGLSPWCGISAEGKPSQCFDATSKAAESFITQVGDPDASLHFDPPPYRNFALQQRRRAVERFQVPALFDALHHLPCRIPFRKRRTPPQAKTGVMGGPSRKSTAARSNAVDICSHCPPGIRSCQLIELLSTPPSAVRSAAHWREDSAPASARGEPLVDALPARLPRHWPSGCRPWTAAAPRPTAQSTRR